MEAMAWYFPFFFLMKSWCNNMTVQVMFAWSWCTCIVAHDMWHRLETCCLLLMDNKILQRIYLHKEITKHSFVLPSHQKSLRCLLRQVCDPCATILQSQHKFFPWKHCKTSHGKTAKLVVFNLSHKQSTFTRPLVSAFYFYYLFCK